MRDTKVPAEPSRFLGLPNWLKQREETAIFVLLGQLHGASRLGPNGPRRWPALGSALNTCEVCYAFAHLFMAEQHRAKPPPLPKNWRRRPPSTSGDEAANSVPTHSRIEATSNGNPAQASSATLAEPDGVMHNNGSALGSTDNSDEPGATDAQELEASDEAEPHEAGPPSSHTPSIPPPITADLWGGRIRVTQEVGRGAMGYVMCGTDTKLGRDLALKVAPLPKHQMPKAQLARFVEEAQVTAQLEHPNVVPVHDLGLDPEGRAYFSMKLIRGQSLEDILEKRQQGDAKTLREFGLRRLLDVFLQVCHAIEYAHARGVIHRDLKPANIMVGDFGEVQVMDWGVAKLKGKAEHSTTDAVTTAPTQSISDLGSVPPAPSDALPLHDVTSIRAGRKAWATQLGTVLGTPAYMSPEQAKGEVVDERADVYALGVILYEMLCGQVPFDDDDAHRTLVRVLTEAPVRPSTINSSAPLALEALALRLLEKDPERRTLTLAQIRAHVVNYIEGIGIEYRRQSWLTSVLWTVGALGLFAFLVWYLTGESIGTVLALGPPAVLNAVGWFVLVLGLGYPLWAASTLFRQSRSEHDRFRAPNREELFVSGYLAHRTLAAAVAPLFQLVFIVELVSVAVARVGRGGFQSEDLMHQFSLQLRAGWAQALIVVLIFLFAYLFLLAAEVRFARQIDRYSLLVDRPRWESVWPFFFIIVLLLTVTSTDVLDWLRVTSTPNPLLFLKEQIVAETLNPFEIVKTLVFQGTFLLGLVGVTVLLSFPFSEVLAAMRMVYQPADEASVASRTEYFLRSVAVFRVARANWLYGGAMIGCLTAISILAGKQAALVEKLLYISGPSLIGFAGYWATQRYVRRYLAHAPAVREMLDREARRASILQARTNLEQLNRASLQLRLAQLAIPVGCVLIYLVWTGVGIHEHAIRKLILPVSMEGWLLILPYALLVPVLIGGDAYQKWRLRRTIEGTTPIPAQQRVTPSFEQIRCSDEEVSH